MAKFKKFSDFEYNKKGGMEEMRLSSDDKETPMNPNLPKKTTKVEKTIVDNTIIPEPKEEQTNESNVQLIGKIAKFPKNIKASNAYNFLENVKVSKKSTWYIMIEKMDNELQMVKYNYKEGINLTEFVNELKSYYKKSYLNNKDICKLIENIKVDGNDKFSMIKNIPLIEIDGQKMITKITEDLIKLLSE